MTTETGSPRSRRALLAAGAAAGVATVASALGRPGPAQGANGGAVILGASNAASDYTSVSNSTRGGIGLWASTNEGIGVYGLDTAGDGVLGWTTSGRGVRGFASAAGTAVHGVSTAGTGAYGESASGTVGVFGRASHATNEVYGVYGDTLSPAGRGVFGRALGTSGGTGVLGQADSGPGIGVRGLAWDGGGVAGEFGTGVMGVAGIPDKASWPAARANTAVMGYSPGGTGVYAGSTSGYALRAVGRVKLDKCAGVTTIPVGVKTVVVTPGIDLVSTSAVVATLMGSAGGTTNVHRVAVNATANTFTIYLTASNTAASPVKVAWHVFG